jgi:hypothetical protein
MPVSCRPIRSSLTSFLALSLALGGLATAGELFRPGSNRPERRDSNQHRGIRRARRVGLRGPAGQSIRNGGNAHPQWRRSMCR